MRRDAAAFALLILLAQEITAAALAHDMTLILPHPIRAGETAWITVHVGPIRRGQEIDVTTAAGRELGVISPFAVRSGRDAGTYTLPLPRDAIHDGRVSVRLTITQVNAAPRAATKKEVRSVGVTISR